MTFNVDFQPVGRNIQVEPGTSILEAAQAAGVGLSAICGGESACGSCRVRLVLDAPVSPLSSLERKKISVDDLAAGIRLACQTVLLDSTRIEVPPESLTALQRTQIEGVEMPVELDPPVNTFDLVLKEAAQTDLTADWERLCSALVEAGAPQPQRGQVNVMKLLPGILRQNDWRVRVGMRDDYLVSLTAPKTPMLGLAVDLGTTKIAVYLIDMENGETLAMRGLMNPQIAYGEDVMARIAYTVKHDQGKDVLQRVVVESINELGQALCAEATDKEKRRKSGEENPYIVSQIVEAVVVGNTAMHHVFLGLPVKQLGLAPYVAAVSSPMNVKAHELGLAFAPGSVVHLLPNIAGFVGADHVSMLLATGIGSSKKVVIGLDIGTNTEITLSVDGRKVACSTASGPAFEGAHIRDGMRAADGAIERIRIVNDKLEYQTIGNTKPVGICGSGILDAVAQLKSTGVMNFRGALEKDHSLVRQGEKMLEVVIVPAEETQHGRDIVLSRKDISEIQMAKGAIRAGIELLLKATERQANDIEEFIIAGAFGSFIDVNSAITIGMFPELPRKCFRQVGNAAGIGAKMSLLSSTRRAEGTALAQETEYLELSNHPEFTNEFARAMSF
ncbi:MAG: DUF4445 domain-containing protein [Proteobacteria bacterium]|nr:DUF4445 domain-containing protein [Pseudomonadota bacterium]